MCTSSSNGKEILLVSLDENTSKSTEQEPQNKGSSHIEKLEEMLEFTSANFSNSTKPQLIQRLMLINQKLRECLDLVYGATTDGLSNPRLKEIRNKLLSAVDRIMDTYPIQYPEGHPKRNSQVARKILAGIAFGGTIRDSAYWAGVSRQFVYEWLKDDPDGLGEAVEAAKATYGDVVNDSVLRLLVGGEVSKIRERYDKNGNLITKVVDLTAPDPKIVIAAKQKFANQLFRHQVEHHHSSPISPEREEKLRKLAEMYLREELESSEIADSQ